MFNDLTSPISLIETRRSGKPRDLIAPGPDDVQMRRIVAAATRVPDHGKLAPWRFVTIAPDRRDAFAELLVDARRADPAPVKPGDLEGLDQFARQAPTLVVVLSAPSTERPIPLWEQEMSAGAAVMNLLHAAHAHGYAAGWLTGWATTSATVRDAFRTPDGPEGERVVGFVFIGTPARPLEERPRPDLDRVVSEW